jgi:uncharacterized protein YdiU (UPF0061 family)
MSPTLTADRINIGTFANSYAALPEIFYTAQLPAPAPAPQLIAFNTKLAQELGLDRAAIEAAGAAEIFSGNLLPAGACPIATAYAGHQFGNFVRRLGDGRAILLGEVLDPAGARHDLQLKGAGRTAYSRGGDGRAALGPVLREYLVSESMHALGVPTTRALAATLTGDAVYRETPLPGAVLTRVASSHIRVGSFQYFAAAGDAEAVQTLADHVIARHYPQAAGAANRYLALLDAVIDAQAALIARWMQLGFIHGVMNTDNMAVAGETIDYGPCAFMDSYDPATVFSSIDHAGRYAYANQPAIANWNLARFAETLLPLIDADQDAAITLATASIENFRAIYENYYLAGMRKKIGLATAQPDDAALVAALLDVMQAQGADFTNTFRSLCDAATGQDSLPAPFATWLATWRQRLAQDPQAAAARGLAMRRVNPAYIPRNHLVEQALSAAVTTADFSHFHRLHDVLQRPYEAQPGQAEFAETPPARTESYRTFCGT